MESNTRPYDAVGRWGGEEFLVVVVNTHPEGLLSIAERFRALVKRTVIQRQLKPVSVTISVGAAMAEKNDTVESLVKRADQCLYRSKQDGRDRVTLA